MAIPDISSIVEYEAGTLSPSGILNLFGNLIETGAAWTLQGHYGRTAHAMIENGLIAPTGEVLVSADDPDVPTLDDEDEDLEEDGAIIEPPVPMTLRFATGDRVRHLENGWFGEVIGVSEYEDGDPAYRVRWDVGDHPTYTYRDYSIGPEYLDGANA